MSFVRTTLITVPVVLLLILLLAEADPIFAAVRDALEHIVPNDFIAASVLLRPPLRRHARRVRHRATRTARRARARPAAPASSLGTPERRVLLTALASIMWLFVYERHGLAAEESGGGCGKRDHVRRVRASRLRRAVGGGHDRDRSDPRDAPILDHGGRVGAARRRSPRSPASAE